MARRRKIRYQLLRNIVLGALVIVLLGAIISSLAQGIIVFMLTGRIPGTLFVVPVWGMFLLYTSILGGVTLVHYLGRPPKKPTTPNYRLPRRRYGHI